MSTDVTAARYARNLGFWSEAEQEALCSSRIALAGVGGDGFQLGLKLAQMGVRSFAVADPEVFEPENANRVPGATLAAVGRNKAEVFRESVLALDADATVDVFPAGVLPETALDFARGADLVVDETEVTTPEVGVLLARTARALDLPVLWVMNVGWAAQATSFHPRSRRTVERLLGLTEDMPLEEVARHPATLGRTLPVIPAYTDLRVLRAVTSAAPAPLPSIAPGVDAASALGSAQAFLHLTATVGNRRPRPTWAPAFAHIDVYGRTAGTVRRPRLSAALTLARAATRDALALNPRVEYSDEDRERRSAA
ncbi:ThiF family adenylyltransferase [Rathayibacter sp. VKM Ac-2857]|uniref:ThiF family adenylyltransferase n=1 Tax=Rathayibacter sp. VKM Ac-2857 TaxID=2739020 RepID=UPI0015670792|nr:ThiF family adenylyltransferase [Rathayibacter sp. VKM Ac-2857]